MLLVLLVLSLGFPASPVPVVQQPASSSVHKPAEPVSAGAPSPNPDAVFAQARELAQRGKFEDAVSILKDLEAHDAHAKGLSHELGTTYYKAGNFVQAVTYLNRALQENPSDKEAVQLLGLSYYFSGKSAEAIPLLEQVQSWFPVANVDASYVLGICYIQQHNYDGARHSFATMYTVPPDSATAYLFTARMLLREEFDPIAESYAQKA